MACEVDLPVKRHSALYHDLIILSLYLMLTLYVMAWVMAYFRTAIPGGGLANADGWQNVWNIWWTRFALERRLHVFSTSMIFHPDGAELYVQHALHITNNVLTLPVQAVIGPVGAYNTAILLGFVLTGYGTYLLVHAIIGHPGVAGAAGALCTFAPFHMARLWDGHLSWVTMQWIPLAMWAIIVALSPARTSRSSRMLMIIIAAVFLTLVSLNSWYHAIYSMIFVVLLAAVRLPRALRDGTWRTQLMTLLLIGGLCAIFLAPILVPTLQIYQATQTSSGGGWDRLTIVHSADLLDWFFPSYLHPIWGSSAEQWHNLMHPGIWGWVITPGIGVMILALIGSITNWRDAKPWVWMVGAIVILSFGPQLHIAGFNTHIPLPYALLDIIPGVGMARRPNHLVIIALPIIALLAAYGMRTLLARGWRGEVALLLLSSMIILEYAVPPAPALPLFVHPVCAELAEEPGAILELPVEHRSAVPMINQTVHHRPIVTGYLSRSPDIPPFVQRVPWVRALWEQQAPLTPDIIPARPDDAWQALDFYDIRTILVWHMRMTPKTLPQLETLFQRMLPQLEPQQRAELTMYQVPEVANPRPLIYLGRGWGAREEQDGHVWRWMEHEADVILTNPFPHTTNVTITMTLESYQHPRPLTLALDEHPLATMEIPREAQTRTLFLLLPPGEHTLRFQSSAAARDSQTDRALSLSWTQIAIE